MAQAIFGLARQVIQKKLKKKKKYIYIYVFLKKLRQKMVSKLILSEGRKWGVRSVVVGLGVFGAPHFSVQRSPITYF